MASLGVKRARMYEGGVPAGGDDDGLPLFDWVDFFKEVVFKVNLWSFPKSNQAVLVLKPNQTATVT